MLEHHPACNQVVWPGGVGGVGKAADEHWEPKAPRLLSSLGRQLQTLDLPALLGHPVQKGTCPASNLQQSPRRKWRDDIGPGREEAGSQRARPLRWTWHRAGS